MSNCTVQIIIPVYNSGKYLHRCLDSLKAQTFEGWQALLIDDGSTDNSADIIGEYSAEDNRFTYTRQENSGVSVARNTALAMLDAKYVTFLDSDDYVEPDMLEVMVSRAEELGADVVQCRYMYDYPSGKQELPQGAFDNDEVLEGPALKKVYRKMMTGITMNHVCMKLVRTSLIGDLRFDTSLRTAEDLHFCVRLFKNVKKYGFVNKPFYHYCRNENSITGKGLSFTARFKANRYVSKKMAKALPDWKIDSLGSRFLTFARPYILIISKINRSLHEKLS